MSGWMLISKKSRQKTGMSKYHIVAETTIHAPIHKVWKIMTSIDQYPEWNHFIQKITASLAEPVEGTLMKFDVNFEDGKITRSQELVKRFYKPTEENGSIHAEWIYDYRGFLHTIGMVRATRTQQLIQLEEGTTHYFTREKFSGWGKMFLPLTKIQAGFITHTNCLKKHCEK
jgi:uncharacterized protein YndB with AHSA1/START domain